MRPSQFLCTLKNARFLTALLVTLAVAGLATAGAIATPEPPSKNLTFEFSFASNQNPEGSYTCDAIVKEVPSGKVLAAPRLVAKKGDDANAETMLTSTSSIQLKVALDSAGKKATATATVLEGEQILSSQTMIVNIGV